jgi:2-dehydropantoate 2-reductase
VKSNLDFIDSLSPSASASMQRDLKKGGDSEIDGLVFEVVRMGRKYGVEVPVYEKVSERFGFKI